MRSRVAPEEIDRRKRERMLDTARQYTLGTYLSKIVAPLCQRVVRAEAGAKPAGLCVVVIDGELSQSMREVGQCACITCGTVKAWDSGIQGMHCGHFLQSRRNSIVLEESGMAPQCASCNYYRGGAPQAFRAWMLAVRGQEAVERLERLKTEVRTFTREELVDLRISYAARLRAAEARMK
jgi:hypothetical protein